jgi:hypothetical protein
MSNILKDLDAAIAEESKHVQTSMLHAWLDNYLMEIRQALSGWLPCDNKMSSPHADAVRRAMLTPTQTGDE